MEYESNNLPFKMKYFQFLINKYSNKSLSNLLLNYKEIDTILNLIDKNQITKFLYMNRNKIETILYKEEENIEIKSEVINDISFYVYLYLIIKNNTTIINYNYSLEFIKRVTIPEDNNIFKIIIISKIILELIWNYTQADNYQNSNDPEINKIKEENEERIKKNINKINNIKQLGLNWTESDIEKKNIDEMYTEIIIALIKSENFGDNNFTIDILNQIEIEKINLTEKMETNLFELLNKEEFVGKYNISLFKDLFNIDKINFIYILFKYLLKEEIFIYQNMFLLKIRKFILRTLKSDNKFLEEYEKSDDNIKNKLKFILDFITGADYYFNRLKQNIDLNNKPKEIKVNIIKMNEYNNKMNVNDKISYSIKNDKISNILEHQSVADAHKLSYRNIENVIIENKITNETIKNILFKSSFKLYTIYKDGKKIIQYEEIKAGDKFYKITDIKEMTLDLADLGVKTYNSYINFIYFLDEIENTIIRRYKKNEKLEIILSFHNQVNSMIEYDYLDINCTYTYLSDKKNDNEYKDENILNHKVYDGFNFLIEQINNEGEEEN